MIEYAIKYFLKQQGEKYSKAMHKIELGNNALVVHKWDYNCDEPDFRDISDIMSNNALSLKKLELRERAKERYLADIESSSAFLISSVIVDNDNIRVNCRESDAVRVRNLLDFVVASSKETCDFYTFDNKSVTISVTDLHTVHVEILTHLDSMYKVKVITYTQIESLTALDSIETKKLEEQLND